MTAAENAPRQALLELCGVLAGDEGLRVEVSFVTQGGWLRLYHKRGGDAELVPLWFVSRVGNG